MWDGEGIWGMWLWWIFGAAFIIGVIWLIIWGRGRARSAGRPYSDTTKPPENTVNRSESGKPGNGPEK